MSLNAKKAGSTTNRAPQPVIEPGVYPARLAQIIDLGVQAQRPYKGKDKPPVQEIMLTYELVDCFMVDEDGNDLEDKPRWVSETLAFYGLFADKAKSTQRYHAFDPNEEFGGEWAKAAGMPINATLVNNASGDKVYTNVANVAAMRPRDAKACPEMRNPVRVFDLDAPDMEVFNALPEWLQGKIKQNLNFTGSPLDAALNGKRAAPAKQKAPEPAPEDEENEDLPY